MSEGGSSFRATGPRYAPAVPQTPEQKLREVSKAYERMFMNEMLKAMRSSVGEGGFIKQNSAEKLFREELDQEYLQSWSERGGVGFADLIYDNLMERFGAQLGLKPRPEKPAGPLPLNERSNYTGLQRIPSPKETDLAYRFDLKASEQLNLERNVTSPWAGSLLGKMELEDGSQVLEIAHDNGLKSRLTFRGQTERLTLGQSLEAGEKIGLLSPEAKAFFWTVGGESPVGAGSETSTGPETVSE